MFPDWTWQVLTLPPRHFSWRIRGNALFWALEKRDILTAQYDFLLATSMVDLSSLRGLVPELCQLPSAVYFHENQFGYPQSGAQQSLLEAQMVNLYSAMAADHVVFNSRYNRETFLRGCGQLLDRLPDFVPDGVVAQIDEKTSVIPVPFDGNTAVVPDSAWPGSAQASSGTPLRIVWLGRFEYDKNPAGLLHLLTELEALHIEYELAIVGQQFRSSPPEFAQIEEQFAHRLVHFGYVEDGANYLALLRAAELALSTALHEFQGLAILQAVSLGAVPVVPARLVYPEIFGAQYCYDSHLDDPVLEARAAARLITQVLTRMRSGQSAKLDVSRFTQRHLGAAYRQLLRGGQD